MTSILGEVTQMYDIQGRGEGYSSALQQRLGLIRGARRHYERLLRERAMNYRL